MKNLSKTQTEQLAENDADKNAEASTLPVAQLEAMSYSEQRQSARNFANNASRLTENVDPKFIDLYETTYAGRIQHGWIGKIKELNRKRCAFKSACTGLTLEQAEIKIVELAKSFNFRGAVVAGNHLEITRGDRDGASLYWHTDRDDKPTVNPDDETQRVYHYTYTFEFNTCGTTYTLARMALVHKIHAELLEAAAEIEATMSRERVISTRGIPEPVAEGGAL